MFVRGSLGLEVEIFIWDWKRSWKHAVVGDQIETLLKKVTSQWYSTNLIWTPRYTNHYDICVPHFKFIEDISWLKRSK